ncbi:MAG: DUF192 domain-containing protein [Rubrobacter sp.]|jgi:uncharacterized membrane protein (UPF0127 family)|nr:DUF192 domain-containing protein [Rubrobacter sp.]
MRISSIAVALVFLFAAGCGGGEPSQSEAPETTEARSENASSEVPAECSEAPLAEEAPDDLEAPLSEIEPLTINASGGEAVEIGVETADDGAEHSQGLMYRESLGERCGMIFVFDEEQTLSFWMRNTLVPLSIAYIDFEGSIVSIHDMEPLDETSVRSEGPAQYALEVNQGFFEENGVEAGDEVEVPE